MNEKIRELIKQAGAVEIKMPDKLHIPEALFGSNIERFAELIIRECAEIADDTSISGPPTGYTYGNVICEHFGVEE